MKVVLLVPLLRGKEGTTVMLHKNFRLVPLYMQPQTFPRNPTTKVPQVYPIGNTGTMP
jgi:hypothetical protein